MEKIKEQANKDAQRGKLLVELIPHAVDHVSKDVGNKIFGKN